jgi:restriction system protein
MSEVEPRVWGIHAGESGEADALFLRGFVALDGAAMGDLDSIADDAAAFKQRACVVFPKDAERTIAQWAGQWRRFVYEAEEGDWIVYKSKSTGIVHLGRLCGPYSFEPQPDLDHAHLRPVQWIGSCEASTMPPHLKKAVGLPGGFCELTDYKADLLQTILPVDRTAGT